MACINMYTPSTSTSTSTSTSQDQQQQQNQGGGGGNGNSGISMSPRISFSSDFILDKPIPSSSSSPATPGNPDFEFAVGTRPMMAADELFFKGRLLPLRHGHGHGGAPPRPTTTLRDELRSGSGADDVASRPKPCPPKWKGLLGLKKVGGHYGNKKHVDKSDHVGAASSFKFASSTQEVLEEEEED
ncbi:uncharacterized protein LOC120263804 [Dioscorea cayenensis subsp. rotundata]|uniref:Uncharacterized protein LOC120263804 n=1 Tax=Dioscorea cayennensis subsp. rotundata TaxID=55577 RepID=A0AB40BJZ2_DIOCR|nr:uncharacterized protein LOC120263804 [Dioscorea cayenensis subsp. rotundata]